MRSLLAIILSTFTIISLQARAERIEDNSFLLEEAYNQEEGVVQFIQILQMTKTPNDEKMMYSFSNEIPVGGQDHQFSYTIPYASTKVTGGTETKGLGDVSVNYRYQLMKSETIAVAPRFSVILPTGKREDGLGTGAAGLQTNLALSVVLNDRWVTHWNAGFTYTTEAKGSAGDKTARLLGTNFATSFVYLAKENLNYLVELVHSSNETSVGDGTKTRGETYYINPGLRYAIDFPSTQIVPGISAPIGIGATEGDDYSILAYFSIEPKLW